MISVNHIQIPGGKIQTAGSKIQTSGSYVQTAGTTRQIPGRHIQTQNNCSNLEYSTG